MFIYCNIRYYHSALNKSRMRGDSIMEQFLDNIVGILWGPTLLIGLLGTGLYFSIITRFWQMRHFFDSFRFCFLPDKKGEMLAVDKSRVTPYQAACVAIAGSIGSGNIGGVASAIALGGPGALFWMWMTAWWV